ncbi:MAG: ATP-binding protein, partial [Polaromonas sp.]|nr:ATP-binding protein [Polaromonas sp.]
TDEQEAQVFHIIQEALANIAKHSMASRAVLAIDKTPRQLEFLIEDDGRGMAELFGGASMAEPAAAAHFGLEIMQGRTQRLGGSLEVGRNEGGGTRVRLVLPANPATGEHAT